MSSEQRHRGPHPADKELFGPEAVPTLRLATADLGWLLSHGYAKNSSLKLVGDRHRLTERQRLPVGRASCSDSNVIDGAASWFNLAAEMLVHSHWCEPWLVDLSA